MAFQSLGLGGAANDGTGDTLRAASDKVNDNFSEIYTLFGDGTTLTSGLQVDLTNVTLTAPTITGVVGGTQTSATITTLTGTTLNAGTLALAAGSVTDSSGAISFGNENLTTTGTVTSAGLTIGSAVINEAELETIDGITAGTVIASKAIVTDSDKDITGGRNITISGELDAATGDFSGDVDVDGTLEADAITIGGVTLAETISDTVGAMVTSNTETGITVSYDDADNTLDFVIGTLNQSTTGSAATLTTARTIGGTSFDGSANIAVGLAGTATALATARTIGGVSFDGSANIDLPGVNAAGNQSTSGLAATATTLATARNIGGVSFNGSANIDLPGVNAAGNQSTSGLAGTATALATARTIGGTSFNGTANIAVGLSATATALATARTIGGTSFDGTANIAVGLAATATALATARTIGGTSFDGTGNIAVALASVGTAVTVADESSDTTCFPLFATAATGDLPPKSGSNLTFNASSGLLTATLFAGALTGNVTGNASGTAATVTGAAQTNITSVGTLTALQVDNLNINGNTLSSTAGTDLLITPLSGQQIVLDGALVIDAGVVTGGTSITSTAFVGNLTGTVATVTQNSITTMTGLVTTGALGAGSIAAGFGAIDNGTSGIRSNTITAETAFVPDANDGADIGTTSLGFNDIFLADAGRIVFGNDQDINLTHAHNTGLTTNADFTVGDDLFVSGGVIDLKNTGAASKILFYCESSNAHAQTLQSQPHSAGNSSVFLLPTGANSTLVSLIAAQTLTNKTLTAPNFTGSVLNGTVATEHGAGAVATSFAPITRRSTLNGVITTKIHFDLTALGGKGATANDVIGLPAGGNAFIGRYVVGTCGIVFRAELACIELPAVASGTLNTDIDIATNSAGDIEYDAAGGTAKLFNTGGMVAGQELSNITPAITANDFFYLVEGGTDAADAVYNAGQFVLTLYGHTIS